MAKYRMKFDLHTHTAFKKSNGAEVTHAQGSVEENVLAAVEKGLDTIGISNHGPGHVAFGLPMDCVPAMLGEIEETRRRHPEIKILFGMEANIINKSGNLDVLEEEFSRFDYIMAGYHYGFFGENPVRGAMTQGVNWIYEQIGFAPGLFDKIRIGAEGRESGADVLIRVNTDMMIAAVIKNRPHAITHPGDKGPFDIAAIARACAETGTFMEINNFHRDLTVEGIRAASKYDVTFIIGSDAHVPEKVGCFEEALERALQAGLDLDRIVNIEPLKAAAKAETKMELNVVKQEKRGKEAAVPAAQRVEKKGRHCYPIAGDYRKKNMMSIYRKRRDARK